MAREVRSRKMAGGEVSGHRDQTANGVVDPEDFSCSRRVRWEPQEFRVFLSLCSPPFFFHSPVPHLHFFGKQE